MPRVEKKKHRRSFGRRRKAWDPITNSIAPRIPNNVRVVAPRRPRPEEGGRRHDAFDSRDDDRDYYYREGGRAAGMGGRRRTYDDDDCRSASGETGIDTPPAAPAIVAASVGGVDDGIVETSFGDKKEGDEGGGRGRRRQKDGRVVLGDRSNVPANDAARTGDSKRESCASFHVASFV